MAKSSRHYSFSETDIKRLEESFFSPPQKKKSHKLLRKILGYSLSVIIIVSVGIILFQATYNHLNNWGKEIQPQSQKKSYPTLTKDTSHGLVKFPVPVSIQLPKNVPSQLPGIIQIPLPAHKKVGLFLDLEKTIDMSQGELNFLISKPPVNVKILMVMRDFNYFSNSFSPYILEVNPEDYPTKEYIKLPLKVTETNLFQLNIHHINQIKLFFVHNANKDINLSIKHITFEKGR